MFLKRKTNKHDELNVTQNREKTSGIMYIPANWTG